MPILDTSFLVDLLRRRNEALALLAELEERGTSLSHHADFGSGALSRCLPLSKPREKPGGGEEDPRLPRRPPLTGEAAIIFGALAARLRSEGKRVGELDEASSPLDRASAHRPSAHLSRPRTETARRRQLEIHVHTQIDPCPPRPSA